MKSATRKNNDFKSEIRNSVGFLKFKELNLTSLHQNNIAYTTSHRDFLKSRSTQYFNEPYTFGYKGCCWQTMSQDDVSELGSGSSVKMHADVSLEFKMIAKVFDVNNAAPRVVLPSMWYINIGCNNSLELHPFDQDKDDDIQCRWADENEAGFATFNQSDHAFINLVPETCQLEFNADIFQKSSEASDWSKRELSIPIAIMIEDFQNNTQRSSMPVQFLLATMPASGSDEADFLNQDGIDDETDGELDNKSDARNDQTMELSEMLNCDLIPVLSSIKDLSPSQQAREPEIIRSFDIYEGGRIGILLKLYIY